MGGRGLWWWRIILSPGTVYSSLDHKRRMMISYQSNINYSFYNLKSILSLLPYARISRSLALCPSLSLLSLLFEEGYVDSSTSMLLLISAAFMLSSLHLK